MFTTMMFVLSIGAFCMVTNEIYHSYKDWGE